MRIILLILTLLPIYLFSDNNQTVYEDAYVLSSVDGNCSLEKNGKSIPLYDPMFKKKQPRSDYSCFAMQKKQYLDCSVLNRKNLSALLVAYGSYEKTNLIIGFKNPHKSVKSSVTVTCTQKSKKK